MDTFSIDVIHSNRFTYSPDIQDDNYYGELKICNSGRVREHTNARIFQTVPSPRKTRFLQRNTTSSSQFFRKSNSVGCSFLEKTVVMERPKMYVSPDGMYRVSQRQLLCVFTSRKDQIAVPRRG